ncbi:hypothetical protein Pmani_019039 [Petrolisthes manimaculis]|uniref:Carbohydrate sulfotransferase n=1 Tax=Petrolisthes manimaculis TaxID=1843537 RepID=A0AAE1PL87_9EUCA|nr:hypothetical protein Pmani_019039 [Petrolisthes manimaculis]
MANVKAKRNVYLVMVILTFIVYQVTLYQYQNVIPTFTRNISPANFLSAYNTISVTPHPFVVAARLKERRDRMRKECGEVDHPKTIAKALARILYAPSHDMFVCASPKAGSSTWIHHLNNMAGFNPPNGNLHTKYWISNVRARKVLGMKEAESRLTSSVNVMIARHPFARFVSAFRDKFADGRRLDKPQSHGHYSLFWKPALRSLNRNISGPLQINFTEFTTFAMKTRKQDPHWTPLTNMCSPCDISYEYILFLETFNEDINFLVNKLNITKINLEIRRNYKSNGTVPRPREGVGPYDDLLTLDPNLLQYYLQLPPHLMAQVIHYYALDLKLLGFQVPPVLTSFTTF